ncbi:hypothetical protein Q8G38_06520 [Halomonas venusta]|uniref:hypothetical protein n=1 Tax=Vreelandella venusta TaxID=44935 RepID=UPI00295E7B77|nr:hypothetical protein [Halomonas venusta]MDW0358969.1 hypothetical protein [Halomonas venusta]
MDDDLLRNAVEALTKIEQRLEELYPGITDEEDVYPVLEKGSAGMALLFHALRTGFDFDTAAKHLKQHCEELERLQENVHMARTEPLRLSLEEISSASDNHFPPPQVAMNTLNYAFTRVMQNEDAYLGEHGGMKKTEKAGRKRQKARTKQQGHELVGAFYALHQQDPNKYPIGGSGFLEAAKTLNSTPDKIKNGYDEASPIIKAAWKSGFPAPPIKK